MDHFLIFIKMTISDKMKCYFSLPIVTKYQYSNTMKKVKNLRERIYNPIASLKSPNKHSSVVIFSP